jgi:hypothetical protein
VYANSLRIPRYSPKATAQLLQTAGAELPQSSRAHSGTEPARSSCPYLPAPAGREPTSGIGCVESYAASVALGSADPHGYFRSSLPPAAAYSHSASVGNQPPSQAQNADASYQVTPFIGCRLLASGRSATAVFKSAESAAIWLSHASCQPVPAIKGCAPAPLAGGRCRRPQIF